MHSHLVAVKVCVVGCTDEWVDADGLALNKHGLKGLHGEAMQRGSAVEHDGVPLGDLFQHVPHLRGLPLNKLLGGTHGVHVAQFLESSDYKWLKEYQCHLFGQPTLM